MTARILAALLLLAATGTRADDLVDLNRFACPANWDCWPVSESTVQSITPQSDYDRLCKDRHDDLCRRLGEQEALTRALDEAEKHERELRASGCVPLHDQVYLTNPPQYDWVCPLPGTIQEHNR